MDGSHPVKLFRHGQGHAVDIPVGFILPGEGSVIRQEGQRLIIEPAPPPKRSLQDLIAQWAAEGPLEEHERMEPIPRAMPRPFDL